MSKYVVVATQIDWLDLSRRAQVATLTDQTAVWQLFQAGDVPRLVRSLLSYLDASLHWKYKILVDDLDVSNKIEREFRSGLYAMRDVDADTTVAVVFVNDGTVRVSPAETVGKRTSFNGGPAHFMQIRLGEPLNRETMKRLRDDPDFPLLEYLQLTEIG